MNDDTRIGERIDRLEQAFRRGEALSPEEVCADCPELLTLVESGWAQKRGGVASTMAGLGRRGAQRGAVPTVPGYAIAEELGRGGMGVVYKAREVELDRWVALKMVLAGAHASTDELTRFQNEAKSVAALEHPHIVKIHSLGEHAGLPFFTMEYCPDGSLEQRVRAAPLSPDEAAQLIEQLAGAMAHAHAQGLIHRDIKPHNILMAKGGVAKITDFGLVKVLGADANLSRTGDVMGAPPYMSPEQASGEGNVGTEADIWALGATLYRLLGGRPPFLGATPLDTIQQVLRDEPAPLRQLNLAVPRDLETICHKCLQKDVHRRYATAADLAEDLRRFRAQEPILARPVGRIEKAHKWARRNKAAAALLLTVLLTAMIGTPAITLLWLRAEWARDQAVAEQRKKEAALQAELEARLAADKASDLFVSLFRANDPMAFLGAQLAPPAWAVAEKRTVGEVLGDLSRELNDEDKEIPPMVRARLHGSLGNSYRNLGRLEAARPHLLEAQRLRAGESTTRPEDRIQSEFDLARLDFELGEFEKARDRFEQIADEQTKAGVDPAAISLTRWHRAMSLFLLGDVAALPALEEARDARKNAAPSNPVLVLEANLAIGAFYVDHGMFPKASEKYTELTRDIDALPPGQAKTIAKAAFKFMPALILLRSADELTGFGKNVTLTLALKAFQECIKNGRETLPPDHPYLCIARYHLAETLDKLERDAEAGAEYRDVLRDLHNTIGVAHPRVITFANSYSAFLVRTDKRNGLPLARELFAKIDAANVERFGPRNQWRTRLLLARSEFESDHGNDEDRAEKFGREALEEIAAGRFHRTREMSHAIVDAGMALVRDGRGAVGAELLRASRELVKANHGAGGWQYCSVVINEGRGRLSAGDVPAARECLREAEKLAESLSPPLTKYLRRHLARLKANLHLSVGKSSEAEAEFRQVLANSRELPPEDFDLRQEDADAVAGALAEQRKFKEALPFAEEAAKMADERKAKEAIRAHAHGAVALLQLAAGDMAGYDKSFQQMLTTFWASIRSDTLAALALVGGASKSNSAFKLNESAARLEATLAKLKQPSVQVWHGLALLRLRAGQFADVDSAMAKIGTPKSPIDFAILGLAARARGDVTAARANLAQAEAAVARFAPSEAKPNAGGIGSWVERLQASLLLAELRSAIDTK